jgi:hypothetical protein
MRMSKALIFAATLGCTDGFVVLHQSKTRSSRAFLPHTSPGKSPLHMTFDPSSLMIASPIFSAAFSPATTPLDPFVEAEIFSYAAHVALDCASLMGPETIAIRALAVLGRIFVMASDYVPDHTMLPDELIFQLAMLCISSVTLARSVAPMLTLKETTMRDRKSYASLFRPVGVTWMQFKVLSAVVLEWVEMAPGAIITTDEMLESGEHQDLYWLYQGQIQIQSKGEAPQTISGKTAHLLGDLTFACRSTKKIDYPMTTAKAGQNGATLLRLDTLKLKKMMRQDDNLDKAVRNMLLDGMQAQISLLLGGTK